MKTKTFFCILLLCCCFATNSCQQTPEKAVVISKNDGVLEEKIHALPDEGGEVTETVQPEDDGMATQQRIETSFDGGKNLFVVDADFVVPKNSKHPVMTVERASITQNDVDKLILAFLGDHTLTSISDARAANASMDDYDDYYIEMISMIKKEIQQIQNYDDLNEDEQEIVEQRVEQMLLHSRAELMESLEEALAGTESAYEIEREAFAE
jgi:hypothetical protein